MEMMQQFCAISLQLGEGRGLTSNEIYCLARTLGNCSKNVQKILNASILA